MPLGKAFAFNLLVWGVVGPPFIWIALWLVEALGKGSSVLSIFTLLMATLVSLVLIVRFFHGLNHFGTAWPIAILAAPLGAALGGILCNKTLRILNRGS